MAKRTATTEPDEPFDQLAQNYRGASLDELPFVRSPTKAEKRAGVVGRIFWDVTPSGDYGEDCQTGRRFGRHALAYAVANDRNTAVHQPILAMIADGPDRSGIEIGFISYIAFQAMEGAPAWHPYTEALAKADAHIALWSAAQ